MQNKRKFLFAFCLSVVLLSTTSQAFASDPFVKLGRGVTNVVTCVGEYPIQWSKLTDQYDPLTATLATIFHGTGFTIVRALSGVYDIVTFPFPLPRDYQSIVQPETIFAAAEQTN